MESIDIQPSDHLSFLLANNEITSLQENTDLKYLAHSGYIIIKYNNKYNVEGILDLKTNTLIEPKKQRYEKSYQPPQLDEKKYGILGPKIGEGTYGKVYKLNDKYAKKEIKLIDNDDIMGYSLNEISILLTLNHKNIINIIDIIQIDESISYIMPLGLGSLDHYDLTTHTYSNYKSIIYQMICAVNYCISRNIKHGDIKLDNFVLFENDIVKLIDFGVSEGFECSTEENNNTNIFVLNYRAPEIILGGKYTSAADIWALGISIYRFYTGEDPFNFSEFIGNNTMLKNIFLKLGNPVLTWPNIVDYPGWNDFKDTYIFIKDNFPLEVIWTKTIFQKLSNILESMLRLDPNKREKLEIILTNDFFESINDKDIIELISCEEKLVMRSRINKIQTIIKKEKIDSIFNWIFIIGILKYKLSYRTFYLFVDVFDSCLNILNIKKDILQLFAGSCLYLASNINEVYGITIGDISISLPENNNSYSDILDMCKHIIKVSKYNFLFSTCYDFIIVYKDFYDKSVIDLAKSILISTIFTELRFSYSNKSLTLLCIFMACCYFEQPFKHQEPDRALILGYPTIIKTLQTNTKMIDIFNYKSKITADKFIESMLKNKYCSKQID